jgi:hypothetical protein
LHLNLARTGIFPPSEQNIRLLGIGFTNIQASIPAGYNTHNIATLTVLIQQSGSSTIANNGNLYGFFHYPSDTANPVAWSVKVDLVNGTTNTAIPSPIIGSLIASLTGLSGATVQNIFANLGGDSDLDISISAYTDNLIPINLTKLGLIVEYDYQNQPNHVSTVEVFAPTNVTPEIVVNKPDLQQRTNGLGTFLRDYNNQATSTVQLTAPQSIENMTFVNWVDQFGNQLTTNPIITLSLGNSQVVMPVYEQFSSVFDLTPLPPVEGFNTTIMCWPTPPNAFYGTRLSTNQLNALANVPGSYSYNPTYGTLLPLGTNVLSVVFTPSDASYDTLTENVPLVVYAPPVLSAVFSNGTLFLGLQVAPNSSCTIQVANAVTGPWTVATNVMANTSGVVNYVAHPVGNQQFYRAVLQ